MSGWFQLVLISTQDQDQDPDYMGGAWATTDHINSQRL